MTSNQKRSAYLRASTYYIVLWGMLALTGSYISIDLNNRGVSEFQWGLITALRSLMILLSTPLITRIADQRNQRVKTLTVILLLMAVAMLFYMVPNHFIGFLIAGLIFSFVSTGMHPIGDSIIVRMAKRHTMEFGQLRMWGSISWVIFGILGGILWERIGYNLLYWIASCLLVLVAIVSTRLEEPQTEESPAVEERSERKPLLNLKGFQLIGKDSVLLLFLLACLFRSAAELMFHSFSSIYINDITQSAFFVGLMRGGAAILEIFVMLFLQKLILRFGLKRILMSGFMVQTLGIGIFAFNINPWIMYIGTLLRSVGFALYFIAAVQFIDQRAGTQNAATYQGLLAIVGRGIAPLLFTPLAGWVYQQWSGQWVFILATISGIVAILVFLPIMIRPQKTEMTPTA